MYLKVNKRHKPIVAITIIVTVILGLLILRYPPALYPDPSWGFQVLRSMQMGGGFNLAITPDAKNIADNTSSYLTWWSPGQYLLPYLFKIAFALNTGRAAAATILFCDLLGIWGFYSFFRKVGFSKLISASSVAFIACQQFFYIPFVFYNGGETLLFGFLGWFLYGCFSFDKAGWKPFLFVLLSGWVGFFCKSAFLWMFASGLLCLWVNLSLNKKQIGHWLKNGIFLAIPAVLSFLAIYKFYISKGSNPASSSPGFRISLEALGFPLASPLLSGFSADDIFHGLLYHPDGAVMSAGATLVVLVLLALFSIILFAAIILFIPRKQQYKLAISAFYLVAVLFFWSVFLRQMDISYEARHFRIVGLLFIPGTLYLFSKLHRSFKIFFMLLWIGIGYTSFRYFISGYTYSAKHAAYGPSGIAQLAIDQPSLDYLQTLDRQHHNNAIFVFTGADLGLDIMHNRIITIEAVDEEYKDIYVADNEHAGYAGPLYILLPAYYMANGNINLVKQCFTGYSNFSVKKLSNNYILLSAQ